MKNKGTLSVYTFYLTQYKPLEPKINNQNFTGRHLEQPVLVGSDLSGELEQISKLFCDSMNL